MVMFGFIPSSFALFSLVATTQICEASSHRSGCGTPSPTECEKTLMWLTDREWQGARDQEDDRQLKEKEIFTVDLYIHVLAKEESRKGSFKESAKRDLMKALNKGFASSQFRFNLKGVFVARNDKWHRCDDEDEFKKKLRVGGRDSLNLYLCDTRMMRKKITANPPLYVNTPLVGKATFPHEMERMDGTGLSRDGVVLRLPHAKFLVDLPKVKNSASNYLEVIQTMVHETGHWLGLLHTFEGGCRSTVGAQLHSNGAVGDGVKDTAAEARPGWSNTGWETCFAGRKRPNTCPDNVKGVDKGKDPVDNYMDYIHESCMEKEGKFTRGQQTRMVSQFERYRLGRSSGSTPSTSRRRLELDDEEFIPEDDIVAVCTNSAVQECDCQSDCYLKFRDLLRDFLPFDKFAVIRSAIFSQCSQCPAIGSSNGCEDDGSFCEPGDGEKFGNQCVAKLGYSENCFANDQCLSGFCAGGRCSECPTLNSEEGCTGSQVCSHSEESILWAGHLGFVCHPKRSLGKPCSANSACQSGKCRGGVCSECGSNNDCEGACQWESGGDDRPGLYRCRSAERRLGAKSCESNDECGDFVCIYNAPSIEPTEAPSASPSARPSESPSAGPSVYPSTEPSEAPSAFPSTDASLEPSVTPSGQPSASPSETPSVGSPEDSRSLRQDAAANSDVDRPKVSFLSGDQRRLRSASPSNSPSVSPTESPSMSPSASPTVDKSALPSSRPTMIDTESQFPSAYPNGSPSILPTETQGPTVSPSYGPRITPGCVECLKVGSSAGCDSSQYCDNDYRCADKLASGGFLVRDGDCWTDDMCQSGHCVGGICRACPVLGSDEGCDWSDNEVCMDYFCIRKKRDTEVCFSDDCCKSGDCREGRCYGECQVDRQCGRDGSCVGQFCMEETVDKTKEKYFNVYDCRFGSHANRCHACALESHWQCEGEQFCSPYGQCVSKRPAFSECSIDENCIAGACDGNGYCTNTPPECTRNSDCSADEFCEEFTCQTKKPQGAWCTENFECLTEACDLLTQKCTECLDDTSCPSDKFCFFGRCLEKECQSASDCPAHEVCKFQDGQFGVWSCVECTNDQHCKHPGKGACAVDEGKCVQCAALDSHCGANQFCQNNFCRDKQCNANEDCSGESASYCDEETWSCVECKKNHHCKDDSKSYCDTKSKKCAVCVEDSHCGSSSFCWRTSSGLQCFDPQCREDSDCSGDKRCSKSIGTCVDCLSHSDCQNDNEFCSEWLFCDQKNCTSDVDCIFEANYTHCDVGRTWSCTQCTADEHCKNEDAPICYNSTVDGIFQPFCVSCRADEHCGQNQYCDEYWSECRDKQCTSHSDCQGRDVCSFGDSEHRKYECVECSSDEHCFKGVCETYSGTCVDCVINEDCGTGQFCVNATCGFQPCFADADCKSQGKAACKIDPFYFGANRCVDCLDDTHCDATEFCNVNEGAVCDFKNCTDDSHCTGDLVCGRDFDGKAVETYNFYQCVECAKNEDCLKYPGKPYCDNYFGDGICVSHDWW